MVGGKLDSLGRTAQSGTVRRIVGWILRVRFHVYWYYWRPIVKKRIDYRGYNILSSDQGNDFISARLESGEPTAIGKLGSVETMALRRFIENRGKPDRWDMGIRMDLYRNAGVFPATDEIFDKWGLGFLDSLRSLDLIAVWYNHYESNLVKKFAPNARLAEFLSLEPYYHKNPFTRCLKGRRVLVIHPFEQSIRRQYMYRDKIWQDRTCLPDFELDTIRAPLSDALAKSGFQDWFDALQHMKTEISRKEFDVAIVGVGAYSIPLVAYVKAIGKFGIHLGGATQILFGIKGRRWDNNLGLRFYNEYWARPLEEDTPQNASIVEDGCYW